MKILVTGGAGYLGSHTVCQLLNDGYDVSVIDNFSNSKAESLNRVKKITSKKIDLHEGDLCDIAFINQLLSKKKISSVIHFAGLKSIEKSFRDPVSYYENNFIATLNLVNAMIHNNIKNFIFSSSATIYGNNKTVPFKEENKFGMSLNPYASTKIMIEQFLMDLCANKNFKAISLRYFNPIGAHSSGLIGEDSLEAPSNLMPIISDVAIGKNKYLTIFGNDYKTRDGTCLRDYFHVMDLADGHLNALKKLESLNGSSIYEAYNLGSGEPKSVIEIIEAFSAITEKVINYKFGPKRNGDSPEVWADITKAKKELMWEPKRSLQDMMIDGWNWKKNNPMGYK